MSRVEGTFSCSDGAFTMSEIAVSKWGFIGRIPPSRPAASGTATSAARTLTVEELPS